MDPYQSYEKPFRYVNWVKQEGEILTEMPKIFNGIHYIMSYTKQHISDTNFDTLSVSKSLKEELNPHIHFLFDEFLKGNYSSRASILNKLPSFFLAASENLENYINHGTLQYHRLCKDLWGVSYLILHSSVFQKFLQAEQKTIKEKKEQEQETKEKKAQEKEPEEKEGQEKESKKFKPDV